MSSPGSQRTPADQVVAPADAAVPSSPPAEPNGPTGTVPVPVVGATQSVDDRHRMRMLTGLSVVAVLLVALTVIFGVGWNAARASGPTANQAFVDSDGTAEVVGQVSRAIVTVYSYNYQTLPQNEADAKTVLTDKLAAQFDKVFGPVKKLAPGQQATMQVTVPAAAVSLLQGDRARLLMMINLTGTRGQDKQSTSATARLVVDARKIDGRWKISEVSPE
jgi:Mce-associated membrane protein